MLFKLAIKNIKKSLKDYSIYFLTLVIGVTIFYIFNSIEAQNSIMILNKSKYEIVQSLIYILSYVSIFVSIILGFLIVYSNNFLIKRRKKELGLYMTLGMSKQKVSTILVIETLLVGLLSLGVGLLLGVFSSQFLSILTAKLFQADMTEFKFIFSSDALIKTIIYFGIIFILVMIFNIITLSRYKLIDLLNAKKRNEKVKFRNKYIVIISFIISIGLLIYAYSLLFDGVLFSMDTRIIYMLIAGAIGTFLLFFSAAGFFLKVFQKTKGYYKNLNMFVIKQINSKVNTRVISTTIICLMLLLTIGILSGSLSLANVYNSSLKKQNKTDITIIKYNDLCEVRYANSCEPIINDYDINELEKNDNFKKYIDAYVKFNLYSLPNITMKSMIDEKTKQELIKQYGTNLEMDEELAIMSESDYNKIRILFNEKEIDLKDNEYLLTADHDKTIDLYKNLYKSGNKININNKELIPSTKELQEFTYRNFTGSSNYGTIIVDDNVMNNLNLEQEIIIGNYKYMDNEEAFIESIKDTKRIVTYTKTDMEAASVGIKAILTYVGLYLGIIFAISSATVLAIGELSDSSDNKERYRVLRQIGADDKMIKRALFTQISIAFLIPLVVALFHAYFGLRELNGTIELIGNIDLTSNIILTTIFIVVVYGGYFLITYLCSKNIIKE